MTTHHTPSATQQLCAWALCLAESGWCLFPLRPGTKRGHVLHARTSCPGTGICADEHQGWEQRATADFERIDRCWSSAAFNIGIATGPSGLLVIDCDQPKPGWTWPKSWNRWGVSCGEDVLAVLADEAGATMPATYTVTTPSGGKHFYFRAPSGFRNTQGNAAGLGPLIDTRAGGGYVVAPGSITPEGAYELLDDTSPVDLPGWLVRALTPKPSPATSGRRESGPVHADRYVSAAIRSACDRLAATGTDPQNQALHSAALQLGRLVAGGAADEHIVRAELHAAMSELPQTKPEEPWTPAQIDATITSAFRWAAQHPRSLRRRGGEAA